MGKDKLRRFAENKTFPHVFQPAMTYPQPDFELKGKWSSFFSNNHPITLELGCGRAEYTTALSAMIPERNFIGIDWKGARIWKGAKTTHENGQANVAFLRILISSIPAFFSKGDRVDEIWITFPDPQPRDSREHRRLTSPEFLDRYRSFASQGCVVHLKTDSKLLYDYTLDVISSQNLKVLMQTGDLYHSGLADDILSIKTTYEKIWLSQGLPIHYVRFVL